MIHFSLVDEDSYQCVSFLYHLLKEREPGESITHDKMPTFDEHAAFVKSRPYRRWYVLSVGIQCVGSCLLTHNNEIGITIAKEYRRKGYAREALTILMRLADPLPASASVRNGHFIANVNPANEASIKLFAKLGFRHIQNTYQFDGRDTPSERG